MSKTFVITDLHGRYDLMMAALERIDAGSPSGGTVIFLGDYVDRGPQSMQIVEAIMDGPNDDRWRWVCLKGNHEDMMVGTLGGPDEDWWLGNGGTSTVLSYGGDIPDDHLQFLSGLRKWHEDDHRVYVHAAVDPSKPLNEQSDAMLLWSRYQHNHDEGYNGKHVVHGHTPVADGPVCLANRTNLDTGAVFTGRLVVAIFDDEIPGGPRSFIEVHHRAAPITEGEK